MRRILIVRTLQADLLAGVVAKLRKVYPTASFSILSHADTQNLEYYSKEFETVFYYTANRDFGLFSLSPSLVRKIRKSKFELVIFPKKMNRLEGFENVIFMLSVFGIKQWAHCSIDGKLNFIKKNYLLRILVTFFAAVVVTPILFLAMLFSLGAISMFRKVRAS